MIGKAKKAYARRHWVGLLPGKHGAGNVYLDANALLVFGVGVNEIGWPPGFPTKGTKVQDAKGFRSLVFHARGLKKYLKITN